MLLILFVECETGCPTANCVYNTTAVVGRSTVCETTCDPYYQLKDFRCVCKYTIIAVSLTRCIFHVYTMFSHVYPILWCCGGRVCRHAWLEHGRS